MPFVDEAAQSAYREAWEAWHRQLEHLHRVFLDGEAIGPDQLKGLLNRESRAKERYDSARLRLLGLQSESPRAPGENPFR
jgi:hypothetical protein